MGRITPWTTEENERLFALRAKGLTFRQITPEMPGRDFGAIKWQWRNLCMTPAELQDSRDRANLRKRQKRSEKEPRKQKESVPVFCPVEVWAEREAALSEPRSLGAWMFGDPPPSRSMLARREVRA